MGNRNPFSAKLVMSKEQFDKFEEDRNLILEKCIMHEFLEPSRTAAYFEEFDDSSERYTHQELGSDIVVCLNGHSKAITTEFLQKWCSHYTNKFAFLVFLCDGDIPSFYCKGIDSVEFDMDGLGSLVYSDNNFVYENDMDAPDIVLVGVKPSECGGIVGVSESLDENRNSFGTWGK